MKGKRTRGNTLTWLLILCSSFAWSAACVFDTDCNEDRYSFYSNEKCCHGTCIDKDATCLSGGAIAGIVIGCLIVGGIILSFCLCFCCACGPFQNRNRGTVIRYGGQTTTTTATTSYPTANVQATYGTSYPQPGSAHYPSAIQGQVPYPHQGSLHPNALQAQAPHSQPGTAPYPSGVLSQPGGKPYPPPTSAPPSYDEATVPPPYNPKYPQTQ